MQGTRAAIALGALAIGFAGAPAGAQVVNIPGLFNTGVDAGGTPLVGGAADPHYTILETGLAARVFDPPHPAYSAVSPSSRWIWENNGGSPGNVTRTFQTSFDLTGLDPTTALVSGRWAVDNVGVDIFLNGVPMGFTSPGAFTSFTNFLLNSGFVAGVNTLAFRVTDLGAPGGLNVTGLEGRAAVLVSSVPEPATVALVGGGLLVLAGAARRRGAG